MPKTALHLDTMIYNVANLLHVSTLYAHLQGFVYHYLTARNTDNIKLISPFTLKTAFINVENKRGRKDAGYQLGNGRSSFGELIWVTLQWVITYDRKNLTKNLPTTTTKIV